MSRPATAESVASRPRTSASMSVTSKPISLSGQSAMSDSSALRMYKVNNKTVRVQPSPGYRPGENSPIKERPLPLPTDPPPDGKVIVHEMIEETLDDLEDHEEWDLHAFCVTMWSCLSAVIGVLMVLASRAMTVLFYSMEPNDILFGFGIVFMLPLVRWFVMLFCPKKSEQARRRIIKKKGKKRREEELKGIRYQIFEDVHANRLQPVVSAQLVLGNDNVSVLTAPTFSPQQQYGGSAYNV
jgi:hypothetical protein